MKHISGHLARAGLQDQSEDEEREQFERDWDSFVAKRQRDLRRSEARKEAERRGRENCRWPNCEQQRIDLDSGKRTKGYVVPLCGYHFEQLVVAGYSLGIKPMLTPPPPQPPQYRPKKVDGFIYYLRIGDTIKIGFASKLRERLSQYPPTAVYLLAHKGTLADEADIHSQLLASLSHGREWYRASDEVVAFVERQLKAHESLPDPRPKPKTGFVIGARNRGGWKVA